MFLVGINNEFDKAFFLVFDKFFNWNIDLTKY